MGFSVFLNYTNQNINHYRLDYTKKSLRLAPEGFEPTTFRA